MAQDRPRREPRWDLGEIPATLTFPVDRDAFCSVSLPGHYVPGATEERGASCALCGSIFASAEHLKEHYAAKHRGKERRYPCRFCVYSSPSLSHVRSHETTHTGDRPFVCHVCYKGFAWKQHMDRHVKVIHGGERHHKCITCGYTFRDKSHLRRHEKVHLRQGGPL
ncbi:zinc finger protein 738-like [Ornithodoros turicata]|uniref:zinc finger protein 738-like n=1 Tax=Ornithodoros turicata TaxID=34597 RepID=UPI00313916CD